MAIELRAMIESDAEELASWATDPVFWAHAGWTHRRFPDEALPWWRKAIAEPDPLLTRLLAVRDGAAVGYVDLHGEGSDVRELGFVVGPSSRWRQGVGKAAAAAGLAYGFSVMGLSRIWAEAVEANAGSVPILRGIGMRMTGWGGTEEYLGVPSRFLQFSLTRAEWATRMPAAADG